MITPAVGRSSTENTTPPRPRVANGKADFLLPNETTTVPIIERSPDPRMPEFGVEWDAAWEQIEPSIAVAGTFLLAGMRLKCFIAPRLRMLNATLSALCDRIPAGPEDLFRWYFLCS